MSDRPSPESAGSHTPLPLVFDEPRGRKKPPRHLADLTADERTDAATSLGLPGFRAKQLSTHYFARLVDDPADMTDLPGRAARRAGRRPAAAADDAAAHASRPTAAPPARPCGGSSTARSSSRC